MYLVLIRRGFIFAGFRIFVLAQLLQVSAMTQSNDGPAGSQMRTNQMNLSPGAPNEISQKAKAFTGSAEEIVQKMVERDKVLVKHRVIYTYTIKKTREKLDAKNKVVSTSEELEQIQGDQSPDYQTRNAEGMEADLKQAAKEEPFNILNILSHFTFTMEEDETINGTLCYKIKFSPKGNQPSKNREEKVANEIQGYLWIAKSDYSLVRNTGKITKPVSVAWFFATLKEMEFLFESMVLPNGELGPGRIEYSFRVQVPFRQVHEKHIREMSDYKQQGTTEKNRDKEKAKVPASMPTVKASGTKLR